MAHCTFSFYGEVFVEPESLSKSVKERKHLTFVYLPVCLGQCHDIPEWGYITKIDR